MKKILSIMIAIALALCIVIPVCATPGEQNGDSLAVVEPSGGAYVIVTNLVPGDLDFKYGWHNSSHFETEALGYWIGVYDISESHYVWVYETRFIEPNPQKLELISLDTTNLISGNDYVINFFVRDEYDPWGNAAHNLAEVQVFFTAP